MTEIAAAIDRFVENFSDGDQPAVLAVECRLDDGMEVTVKAGKHRMSFDEPRFLGGGGTAPTPVAYALATLGACEAIGYRIWSEKLGVPFDEVRVTVEGDLDLSGPFTNERYPGFQSVRMTVFIRGREPADRYAELERQVEANSPVLALFRDPIPVATEVVFESPA